SCFGEQGCTNSLAKEVRPKRRTEQDFFGPAGGDRGGAVEFEGTPSTVDDQKASEHSHGGIQNDGQEPKHGFGWRGVVFHGGRSKVFDPRDSMLANGSGG